MWEQDFGQAAGAGQPARAAGRSFEFAGVASAGIGEAPRGKCGARSAAGGDGDAAVDAVGGSAAGFGASGISSDHNSWRRVHDPAAAGWRNVDSTACGDRAAATGTGRTAAGAAGHTARATGHAARTAERPARESADAADGTARAAGDANKSSDAADESSGNAHRARAGESESSGTAARIAGRTSGDDAAGHTAAGTYNTTGCDTAWTEHSAGTGRDDCAAADRGQSDPAAGVGVPRGPESQRAAGSAGTTAGAGAIHLRDGCWRAGRTVAAESAENPLTAQEPFRQRRFTRRKLAGRRGQIRTELVHPPAGKPFMPDGLQRVGVVLEDVLGKDTAGGARGDE